MHIKINKDVTNDILQTKNNTQFLDKIILKNCAKYTGLRNLR